jgi:nitroreductase/NAD-dependent dihydropyrimidine dehydrogenase PreA subunit
MTLFRVDDEKCTRCGSCADECVARIIQKPKKGNVPVSISSIEDTCINCGHCVSFCPTGAFTLNTMNPDQLAKVDKKKLPSSEEIAHFLKTRRSIRTFQDRPVEREVLTKIIEVARYAPSGKNKQPANWTVIYDKDKVKKYAGLVADFWAELEKSDPSRAKYASQDIAVWKRGIENVCWSAPHLVLIHAEGDNWEEECKLAMEYFDLAAYSVGVGTCWAGWFRLAANYWNPLKRELKIPVGEKVFAVMMVGYPAHDSVRVPLRNEAKITWI